MRVILFGATGMVGQGTLRECLLADDVEQVLSIGRRPSGVRDDKLAELVLDDLGDLTAVEDRLVGYDACFYCLGISSAGVSAEEYARVCHDLPVAAARLLAERNPDMTFVYVSGAGTDPDGRARWARVKGRTEQAVIALFPRGGYAFRPGFIQPRHGARSRTRLYRVLYTALTPIASLLVRVAPGWTTTTDRVGRAMLRAARTGFPTPVVANRDLR